MGKIIDISGNKYGKLTVIGLDHICGNKTYWKCKCDCGNYCVMRKDTITRKNNQVRSCGCVKKENCKKLVNSNKKLIENRFIATHGDSKTRFYKIFAGMKYRCYNKNHSNYKNYGGKNIIVEWNSYEEFKKDMYESYLEHCKEYGEKNTTIDRIDVEKNYSKDNCRWATCKEQMNNLNNTIRVIMNDGSWISISDLSRKLNIKYSTLSRRYQKSKYNHTHKIPYNELIKDKDIV